jgi:hypothetical protein
MDCARAQLAFGLRIRLTPGRSQFAGDEGIEWIKNEPYDNTDGHLGVSEITGTTVPRNKGQYTLKRYHFKSKVPGIVTHLAPSNALFLIEEAWNAYPHW